MKELSGQVAIVSGPIVYSLEDKKKPGLDNLKIDINTPMKMSFNPGLLGGVNPLTGTAINGSAEKYPSMQSLILPLEAYNPGINMKFG